MNDFFKPFDARFTAMYSSMGSGYLSNPMSQYYGQMGQMGMSPFMPSAAAAAAAAAAATANVPASMGCLATPTSNESSLLHTTPSPTDSSVSSLTGQHQQHVQSSPYPSTASTYEDPSSSPSTSNSGGGAGNGQTALVGASA